MSGDRGDIDDAAGAALQHVSPDFGAGEEDAGKVGCHEAVVVGAAEFLADFRMVRPPGLPLVCWRQAAAARLVVEL